MKNNETKNRIILMVILVIATLILVLLPTNIRQDMNTSIDGLIKGLMSIYILKEYILPILNTVLLIAILIKIKK